MALTLDPRYPLVWRTPHSLQLGVASPPVVIDPVTTAVERMLDALVHGVTLSGLGMIGRDAGASEADVDAFVTRVRPALLASSAPSVTVLVAGSGLTAERIARGLAGAGVRVVATSGGSAAASAAHHEPCDLAVIVAHYVIEPQLHGAWLRRDIPHLPVVIADTSVMIGPFVEPGVGPCLYCLMRARTDADAAWPAIASQLWGAHSAAETPLLAGEIAAIVARLVTARAVGGAAPMHEARELDVATGVVTRVPRAVHPSCECSDLGRAELVRWR
ncbi:MAG: hypothetical protein ACOH1T_03435 [Microbacteriaceae bacterium]